MQAFFKETPDAPAYFAVLDVNANAKVLQGVVLQAKKLSKSVYVFSADAANGKVAHVNAVSDAAKAKGLDGREWATVVTEILGGKVRASSFACYNVHGEIVSAHMSSTQAGGRPDGAQGVGTEVAKVQEALEAARQYFESKVSS